VDERNAAQAVQLIRALRDQRHEMTRQLARLERQGVIGTNGRISATIRHEAAALRRDIRQAQTLIDRLEHRYLNGDGRTQPRQPEHPRRSTARLQPRSQATAIRW
jgi:hypothetical protein